MTHSFLQICRGRQLCIYEDSDKDPDLQDPKIQTLIDNFLNNTYAHTNEGVTLAVKYINYIFEKSAKLSKLKTKNWKNQILKKDKKWFDQTCQTIRKNLRTLSNQKHNDPNNAEIRHLYCATLKQYKHTLRTKKAQYTQKQLTIINKINNKLKVMIFVSVC